MPDEMDQSENQAPARDERETHEALKQLVEVIDAAGLIHLSNGVQLGATSWFVKASDAMDRARAALRAAPTTTPAPDFDPITCPIIEGDMNGPHGPLPIAQPSAPTAERPDTGPAVFWVDRGDSTVAIIRIETQKMGTLRFALARRPALSLADALRDAFAAAPTAEQAAPGLPKLSHVYRPHEVWPHDRCEQLVEEDGRRRLCGEKRARHMTAEEIAAKGNR